MTVTVSVPGPWTIDDLVHTPNDGNRYELVHGSLLVTPPPTVGHGNRSDLLRGALARQAPRGFRVLTVGLGIDIRRRTTCYVPDLLITTDEAMSRDRDVLNAAEVLLVAEVLSPGNRAHDPVQKRHDYAACGIPQYWIVDPREQTLTVLTGSGYRDELVLRPGERWRTDQPYAVELDPGEFL
jgi:Uma2 family endonuclease